MNVCSIAVFRLDGLYSVRYRYADSDPFLALAMDGKTRSRVTAEIWANVLYELQADPNGDAMRLLLCSDYPMDGDAETLPKLRRPCPWSRRTLAEAMERAPCAGRWTVNGETLSPGDFRETFPVKAGEKPLYVYTVPDYSLPGGRKSRDALSVLAETLKQPNADADASETRQAFDAVELMREALLSADPR